MIAERSATISSRSRQRRPTERQLALIAWTVAHPARDASFGERAMIANKLTRWLTKAEQHQISEFIADKTAMRKALKKPLTKRQSPSADGDWPPAHFDTRRSHIPSDLAISVRFSSWLASAAQLREIFVSTVARRAEFLGSAARSLYSAA